MTQTSARAATRIEWQAETVEDVLRRTTSPVGSTVRGTFVAVQRPADPSVDLAFDDAPDLDAAADLDGANGIVELLTVSPNNELLHIRRDPDSETGWRSREVPVGIREDGRRRRSDGIDLSGEIVEIQAFYQRLGRPDDFRGHRIMALVHFPEDGRASRTVVPMIYDPAEDRWEEMYLRNRGAIANALTRTRQTAVYRRADGKHYFYGVSTAAGETIPQLFLAYEGERDGESVWDAELLEIRDADARSATYRLLPLPEGDDSEAALSLLKIAGDTATVRPLYWDWGYGLELDEDGHRFALGHKNLTAANVLALPTRTGNRGFLLHTPDDPNTPAPNQLYYVTGHEGGEAVSEPLTGGASGPGAVDQVVLGRDARNRVVLFAIDAGDRFLWLRRQGGFKEDGSVRFGPWVPLGEAATTVGCPRAMLDGPELFMVTPQRNLVHFAQDPKTSLWHTTVIAEPTEQAPAEGPEPVHAVTFTVANDDGPIGGAAVELTAGVPCTAVIGSVSFHLDSRRKVLLTADAQGQVTVKLPAEELTSPRLTLVADGGVSCDADPSGRVTARLAGSDDERDVTRIETEALSRAGLVPPLKEGDRPGATAEQRSFVTRMVRNMGTSMAAPSAAVKKGDKVQEFTMDTTDADDPKFEYDGQKRAQADGLSPVDVGSRLLDLIPDDLDLGPFSFLGDVVNWMKRAIAKAKKWVVTMAKGVVNFVIQIGADITEFVIDTAAGMAQAFGNLMQQVAAAFEALGIPATAILKKIVGFITRKLGWGDVVRMSEFLEGMTNRTLTAVEEFFDKEAVDWVNGTTATLKRHIDTAFGDAERLLKGFDPFNPSDIKSSSDGGIASATRFAAANKVAMGTVTRQIESNKDRVAQAASSPDRSDPGLASVVAYITDDLWPKIKQHFGTLVADIEPMFANGVEGLLKHGLVGMLRAGKTLLELCIDLAAGLLNVVLKVVAALFRLIRSVLNTPVYLPVISEFWNWSLPDDYRSEARHSELSILRMMTAAVALPVTLMHKAFHGALPDLRDVDRKMEDSGLSWSGLLRGAAAVGDEVPLLRSLRSAGASANTETKDLSSSQRAALRLVAELMVGDSQAADIRKYGPGDTPEKVKENLKWAAEVWPPRRNLIQLILATLGPIARIVDLVCKLVLIPLVTMKRLYDSATAGAVPPLSSGLELLRKVVSIFSKAMKIPKVLDVASTIASTAIATLPGQPSRKDSGGLPAGVRIPALIASVAQAAIGASITIVLGLVDALSTTSMSPFAHFVSELLHCFLEVHLAVVAGIGQIVTFVDRAMSSGAELGIIIPDLIASLLGDIASCLEVVSGCFNWLAALGAATAAEGVGIAVIAVLVALSLFACSGSVVVGLGALAPASVRSGFVVARNLRDGVG